MPGDYLFPKRRFTHGEPVDADELNEALQPAVERVNGFIGPHNLRAPLDSSIAARADTFFRTRQVFVEVPSGLSDTFQSPDPAKTDGFVVEQDTSWQLIESDTADKDMVIDIATGTSTLSLTAFVSYCFHGYDDGEREVWSLDLALPSGDSYADYYDDHDGLITIRVALEGPAPPDTATSSQYHEFSITLPRPGNMTAVREKIAKRIASAGAATDPAPPNYAISPWGASGYSAKAEGTKVLFTRLAAGPSAAGTYFWAKPEDRGSTDMVEDIPAVVATTSQKLSDLASMDTSGGAGGALVYFPAQIQFALRVDGVVLPETITGRYDNEQGSFQPSKIESAKSTLVGLMVPRFKERPDALGIPMHTVRLTYDVSVRPGVHRVELVARRAPMAANRKFRLPSPTVGDRPDPPEIMPEDSRVTVYNRQMKVVEVPSDAVDVSPFGDAVTIPALGNEDVVSHESLDDARLRVVVDALNDLKAYQVARGAINGAHLANYSAVLALAQGTLSSGGVGLTAAANPYLYLTAGRLNFGQFYDLYPVAGGWVEITTSKFNTSVPANTPCVISVEGNVFLNKLQTITAATSVGTTASQRMHLGAAVFCVGLKVSGAWYLWMPSIAWVNSNLYWASEASGSTSLDTVAHLSNYSDNNGHDYFDVPVSAEFVFNYDNVGLLRQVDEVGIFGSVCRMHPDVTVTNANVKRASVNAVATKS